MPGGFPDGNRPPASPLLEPYHGTYQSMSPMPWPTAYSDMEGDVSELELDDGAISSSERAKGKMLKIRKTKSKDAFHKMDHLERQRMAIESMMPTNHVPVYDPRIDAKALKSAISHHKIDPKPLLEILPNLTAEEVLVLRAEYKNIVKMTGHGVNIAKHIALRVPGNGHLCEVMRMYESMYNQHFARAMIAKSQNLVGESLIHILNGALNRPMRDALLLHHAIAEVGTGRDRAELLISRLVRMHWEPHHLERAKAEYKRRYGKYVEDHIVREIINKNGNGKCDWAEFCIELVKSSTQHVMDDE
ncbi:annexin ANXC4 [Coccidioides immitis H538.4]|uniref:Annexin ANXC4 n=1 Tax=Coccidioides immitis H538.4 TaxID=396776 RepID=A0A0J8RGW5_COCIT|nr:annexin ANXC4 [Coccidioides immitis H538.4]